MAQTCAPGVSVSQAERRYDANVSLIFKRCRDPRCRPAGDGVRSSYGGFPFHLTAVPGHLTAVQVKAVHRQIDPDGANLFHGCLLLRRGVVHTVDLAHHDAVGRRASIPSLAPGAGARAFSVHPFDAALTSTLMSSRGSVRSPLAETGAGLSTPSHPSKVSSSCVRKPLDTRSWCFLHAAVA